MDRESLNTARKQLVAKRNDLVQNARLPLTKLQNEVIQYMVSKVKPMDEPGTQYTFKCSEFYALIGNSSTSYTDIKALLSEIRKINWWIDSDDGSGGEKNLTWFNVVHMNPKSETVTISFHEDIEPYIFKLAESKQFFFFLSIPVYFINEELLQPKIV